MSKQELESRYAAASTQETAPVNSTGVSSIADQEVSAAQQNEAQHSSRSDEVHADSSSS